MKFKVELRCLTDDQEDVRPIACLEREGVALETPGLTLAEGKAILRAIQEVMVEKPLTAYVEKQRHCPDCGALRPNKGYHEIRLRTAFGNLTVNKPAFASLCLSLRPGKDLQSACPAVARAHQPGVAVF